MLGPPEPVDELGVAPDIRSARAGAAHPNAEPPLIPATRAVGAGPQLHLSEARLEQDLRTGRADLRVVAQRARQRSEPARFHEHVAVDERHRVDVVEVVQREVAAAGEPAVPVARDDPDVGPLVARPVDDAVRRRVVDEHDLEEAGRPLRRPQPSQTLQGEVAAVVVEDNGADARRLGHDRRCRTTRSNGSR